MYVDKHVLCNISLTHFVSLYFPTGADFTSTTFTFKVGGESIEMGTFLVRLENVTIDDDIVETEQSFALIAEIGDDVPENFTCFQRKIGDPDCFERTGITEIRIVDNDGKSKVYYLVDHITHLDLLSFSSYDNWI